LAVAAEREVKKQGHGESESMSMSTSMNESGSEQTVNNFQ
jgi:hypothetical protein